MFQREFLNIEEEQAYLIVSTTMEFREAQFSDFFIGESLREAIFTVWITISTVLPNMQLID